MSVSEPATELAGDEEAGRGGGGGLGGCGGGLDAGFEGAAGTVLGIVVATARASRTATHWL